MIVTCESCGTKFRLDDERIKKAQTRVRCSHCGHIFMVVKETDPGSDTITGFEMPQDLSDGLDSPPYSSPYAGAAGHSFRLSGLTKKLLVVVLTLVLLGGAAFWFFQSHQFTAFWFFQSLPFTPFSQRSQPTTAPTAEGRIAQVVVHSEVKSFFLENTHTGQIFVIQGEVTNESAQPVSFVLVEGKLYTENNQVARSQRCYCGNMISREDLKRLDMTDIQNLMMNREGTKLSNVQVAPQARVPFMVVFHNLPDLDQLKDYSVEVVSADFEKGT